MSAEQILSAWISLEVLSPRSFKKPEELIADQDPSLVTYITHTKQLPWENLEKQQREEEYRKKSCYYHLILGTINLESAVKGLLNVYADPQIDPPNKNGEAILAAAIIGNDGKLIESTITVSSFGWGLPQALDGKIKELANWSDAEKSIIEDLNMELCAKDENGHAIPINMHTIQHVYRWLINRLKLPENLTKAPYFVLSGYQKIKEYELCLKQPNYNALKISKVYLEKCDEELKYIVLDSEINTIEGKLEINIQGELTKEILHARKAEILKLLAEKDISLKQEAPESLILNSFFLEDLERAKILFLNQEAPANLERYLNIKLPQNRYNLLKDPTALEDALTPSLFSPARWPSPGRNSLVLLQQAAVNLALNDKNDNDIIAVNGPPGTGKTTLLRDNHCWFNRSSCYSIM